MAKKRTATTQAMVDKANTYLALDEHTREAREFLADFVKVLLMENGTYDGYNYIYWQYEGGFTAWMDAGEPEGPEKDKYLYGPSGDQTRVRFY